MCRVRRQPQPRGAPQGAEAPRRMIINSHPVSAAAMKIKQVQEVARVGICVLEDEGSLLEEVTLKSRDPKGSEEAGSYPRHWDF